MHSEAWNYVCRAVADYRNRADLRIVELGSRDINGSPRRLFNEAGQFYWGVDIVDGPGVDEVRDAAIWSTDELFDVVISTEVFEHTTRWPGIVRSASRALKPGGRFVFTCATDPRPKHAAGGGALEPDEFYRNVPEGELRAVLEAFGFEFTIESYENGDLYASGTH